MIMLTRRALLSIALGLSIPLTSEAFEGSPQPLSQISWNIGAGDLLQADTAACRLGVYLDELAARGDRREIRIIYTHEWGPFILEHWIPVIRAKGFRLNVILSQWAGDKDVGRLEAWIRAGLPSIADLIDGVQIANEPDGGAGDSGMSPSKFAAWHRQIAPVVRQVVPGVPIISPDLYPRGTPYVKKTGLQYNQDFDVYSLHTTGRSNSGARSVWRSARKLSKVDHPRVWITEGSKKHSKGLGARIERNYVYTWNCNSEGDCDSRMRRPDEDDVQQCEKE